MLCKGHSMVVAFQYQFCWNGITVDRLRVYVCVRVFFSLYACVCVCVCAGAGVGVGLRVRWL